MQQRSFLPVVLAASILVLGLFAAPARAADDNVSYVRIVRLSYVSGDVQIVRADQSGKWEPAYANMPIQQGFTLGTNNGRAEVEFENGSALWLAEKSVIQFTDLALSNGGRITKMVLTEGTGTFEADIKNGDTFVVSTSQFEVTPLVKSRFRVDAFSDGGSVSMFSGNASVNSDGGAKQLERGQTLALGSGGPAQETVRQNPARDSWDRWVNDRANYLSNGATQSLQYTNSPFSYGMADLASYGMWSDFAGCGYGWQPYASMGWTPFLNGQWMYYPSFGWSWVSYEPWGWTPYHFGNWLNCAGNGWIWQPGGYGYWLGAPVEWVGIGKRIGWRPTQPRANPIHAAAAPIVVATKNLGKEGRYEVVESSKAESEVKSFSAPPLADGKIPPDGATDTASAGGRVVVPTSSSLLALQSQLAVNGAVSGLAGGGGAPTAKIMNGVPREGSQVASLPNVAPHPASGRPSLPPVRTFVAPPSSPGQPSYHPAPAGSTTSWGGASSSSARSGPSPSFGSSGASHGGAPASAPAPPSSGSGGHPH
jgi:hypothetical protein